MSNNKLMLSKQLKLALKSKRKKELIDEICFLAEHYKEVENHYNVKYGAYEIQSQLYNEVCSFIHSEFNSERGLPTARIDKIKNTIKTFKIRCNQPALHAGVYIYFIHQSLNYAIEYKDIIYDPIDRDIYNAFHNTIEILQNLGFENLQPYVITEIKEILESSKLFDVRLYHRLVRTLTKYNFPIIL